MSDANEVAEKVLADPDLREAWSRVPDFILPKRLEYTLLRALSDFAYERKSAPTERVIAYLFRHKSSPARLKLLRWPAAARCHYYKTLSEHLGRPITPFYTVAELGECAERMLSRIEESRDAIVSTGWRAIRLEQCPWIDWHLGNLYYTKFPCDYTETKRPDGNLSVRYYWPGKWVLDTTYSALNVEDNYLGRFLQSHPPAILRQASGTVTYAESPIIPLIEKADAEHIESLREKLLEMKIGVVKELARSLSGLASTEIWAECLKGMARVLTKADAAFLRRMDRIYLGWDSVSGEMLEGDFLYRIPGGLTNIFEVMGQCEQEMTLGVMARTKDSLRTLGIIREDDNECSCTAPEYCWSEDDGELSVLGEVQKYNYYDDILTQYLRLEAQAVEFWARYRKRVSNAIDTAFDTRIRRVAVQGAELGAHAGDADSQDVPHNAKPPAKGKRGRVPKPPGQLDRDIARLYEESGMTQQEVAHLLTEKRHIPINQKKVSNAIKRENKWRKMYPELGLPEIKTRNRKGDRRMKSMDPADIEMGERIDGRAKRQRAKRSDDG